MSDEGAAIPLTDDPWTLIGHLNEDRYRVYQRDGYRIWLNVSESRDMARRAAGRYEPETFAAIRRHLAGGGTFLDIGGNKGDFSLFAAARVGAAGRVICVEPHPENVAWIERSIALNRFGTVAVVEAALADRAGSAPLHVGPKSGHHALEPLARDRGSVTVAVDTLDALWRRLGGGRLDMVKIDVEGAEDRVVAGGRNTLAEQNPVVLLDVHDIGAARLAALASTIGDLGYRIATTNGDGADAFVADRGYLLLPA